MSKSEERALEIFPSTENEYKSEFGTFHFDDTNIEHREGFIIGYELAEKDLALTAEDVSCIIHLADQFGKDYQKIANVFNKDREEEQK